MRAPLPKGFSNWPAWKARVGRSLLRMATHFLVTQVGTGEEEVRFYSIILQSIQQKTEILQNFEGTFSLFVETGFSCGIMKFSVKCQSIFMCS